MAEKRENGKAKKPHRLARFLGGLTLALLVMAAVYLAAVLLQSPEENLGAVGTEAPGPEVSRMQSAAMEDPQALSRLFEASLPVLPGYACRGEAGNESWDGKTARIATLAYEGFTVTAVQPASAAPLLLRPDLETSLQSGITVLGLPAMLAERETQKCLYFSNETAAYALYAPNAESEDFFALAQRLQWTP